MRMCKCETLPFFNTEYASSESKQVDKIIYSRVKIKSFIHSITNTELREALKKKNSIKSV